MYNPTMLQSWVVKRLWLKKDISLKNLKCLTSILKEVIDLEYYIRLVHWCNFDKMFDPVFHNFEKTGNISKTDSTKTNGSHLHFGKTLDIRTDLKTIEKIWKDWKHLKQSE